MDKQELHKADVEIENWIAFQQGDQRALHIYQAYFTPALQLWQQIHVR